MMNQFHLRASLSSAITSGARVSSKVCLDASRFGSDTWGLDTGVEGAGTAVSIF